MLHVLFVKRFHLSAFAFTEVYFDVKRYINAVYYYIIIIIIKKDPYNV